MNYNELTQKIKDTQKDLDLATTPDEISYFGNMLMMLEDKMDRTISKGRR